MWHLSLTYTPEWHGDVVDMLENNDIKKAYLMSLQQHQGHYVSSVYLWKNVRPCKFVSETFRGATLIKSKTLKPHSSLKHQHVISSRSSVPTPRRSSDYPQRVTQRRGVCPCVHTGVVDLGVARRCPTNVYLVVTSQQLEVAVRTDEPQLFR